jgi:hypothetical protein
MKRGRPKKQAIPVDLDWKREYKKLKRILTRVNVMVVKLNLKYTRGFSKIDSLFSEGGF